MAKYDNMTLFGVFGAGYSCLLFMGIDVSNRSYNNWMSTIKRVILKQNN